jgi:hypothetical protein
MHVWLDRCMHACMKGLFGNENQRFNPVIIKVHYLANEPIDSTSKEFYTEQMPVIQHMKKLCFYNPCSQKPINEPQPAESPTSHFY